MFDNSHAAPPADIDIQSLMAAAWHRKFLLLIITVIAAVGLFTLFSSIDPRYRSSTKVLIEQRESVFTKPNQNLEVSRSRFDKEAVGSQVQVINSDDIALEVIRTLALAEMAEFDSATKPSALADLKMLLGIGADQLAISAEQRVLKEFRKRLKVFQVKDSRVIVIQFWSHNRTLAASVANGVARAYLSTMKQTELSSSEDATAWLQPEIIDLRNKVKEAESKVAEFRSNSDILIGANNAALATQQLSEISTSFSRAKAARSVAEAKVRSIQAALADGASLEAVPEVVASPLVQRFLERRAALQGRISQLSTTLLQAHPQLIALKSQVKDFDRQIASAARNIQISLENNLDIARQQEEQLGQELNRVKAESARVGEAEVELRALEREAAAQRDLLSSYLTRFREISARQERDYLPVDARVISRAIVAASHYFPKVLPFTLAGTSAVVLLWLIGLLGWLLLSGVGVSHQSSGREKVGPDGYPHAYRPEPPNPSNTNVATNDHLPWHISPEGQSAQYDRARQSRGTGMGTQKRANPGFAGNDVRAGTPRINPDLGGDLSAFSADRYLLDPVPDNLGGAVPTKGAEVINIALATRAIGAFANGRVYVLSAGKNHAVPLSVAVARGLVGLQKQAIVLDLSGDGRPGREMTDSDQQSGLWDILAGIADLKDVIHLDHCSPAYVMPSGKADPRAMQRSSAQVLKIADVLAEGFDYLITDCGQVSAPVLNAIASKDGFVLIDADGADMEAVFYLAAELEAVGYSEVAIISRHAHGSHVETAA